MWNFQKYAASGAAVLSYISGFPILGIKISAELCGHVGLGLLGGSYMTESIRSGLESVPKIQTESALSLGMTKPQLLYVILPQAFP